MTTPAPQFCAVCRVELTPGSGRYLVAERVLCVACYDLQQRGPELP